MCLLRSYHYGNHPEGWFFMTQTAESVTKFHPDKICDQVADLVLDACLRQDPYSRVAVEAIGGHGLIVLVGEVTTKASLDVQTLVKNYYKKLLGKSITVTSNIAHQSPEISQGVDTGGAGDQGIMVGYACNENKAFIPQEMFLSRQLLRPWKTDGKSQVTIDNGKVTEVVLSVQGHSQKELQRFVHRTLAVTTKAQVYCNNTGNFDIGGFDADSGCTGRKIVVDAYGPRVPVGGGSFSGKDPTKVDRSGAYMARWLALRLLKKTGGKEALVKLAYVIGKPEPIMMTAYVDARPVNLTKTLGKDYDCRVAAIIDRFDLRKPIYLQTAASGHFGFNYPWEVAS